MVPAMSTVVETSPPKKINAATTVKWTRSYTDYPADDGWTLTFYASGVGTLNAGSGVAGVANGAAFDFTLTTAHTALAAGTYRWEERATKAGETYVVASGYLEVVDTLVGAAAGAAQEQAEKDLIVIKAAISGRLTSDMQAYQIAGRAVTKIPVSELYGIKARLEVDLYRLRNPGKAAPSMRVQFSGPGGEG